jgi:hypothetical protein
MTLSETVAQLEHAREDFERERAFWDANGPRLRAEHPNHFVAVRDGQVIGTDDRLAALLGALASKGVNLSDVWIRYLETDFRYLL